MTLFVPFLPWLQIILSVILVALILLQQNEASLGGAFGGADSAAHAHRKRGVEKIVFNATIATAILFVLASLAALFV